MFGFYLRLEDRARRRAKRLRATRALGEERERARQEDFQNLVLGRCQGGPKAAVLNREGWGQIEEEGVRWTELS